MHPPPRHTRLITARSTAGFIALVLMLYAAAATLADRWIARTPGSRPFQILLARQGQTVDWLVIGSSHAMPLEFGGIPARLGAETGQSMMVLAETGAGPLYALFVARQAHADLTARRVLYILDDFAFYAPDWNEDRIADRTLLRHTPTRLSTASGLWQMVRRESVPVTALADYLTAFSKLNPPERFPQPGWEGRAAFDKGFRPSRHAIQSRAEYLFPDGTDMATANRYLGTLEKLIAETHAAGSEIEILRLPVAGPFRDALPDLNAFDARLGQMLQRLNVPLHDLRAELPGPEFYFDPDHLNRQGMETLYESHLQSILH
ncbi:SGNH/GDSL hydrolase family protein [Marimonas lutisalis]|uniref:SGNH/GDSL hydrolase family protein n=1 Tax=Marimonas lutisalis TaxID=2545756 RepID=UPI0010F51B98|nr:SGNH/GDSL hydrolase family protein [Marimonas lutisalis]